MNTTTPKAKKPTKKERERSEAVETLKSWGLVDGATVYAKVSKVSRSGMHRRVHLYISKDGEIVDISYWAAKALEWGYKDGFDGGIGVSGCGMDMLFHTVYSLSYSMGYGSLNQGRDDTKNDSGHIGLRYRQM